MVPGEAWTARIPDLIGGHWTPVDAGVRTVRWRAGDPFVLSVSGSDHDAWAEHWEPITGV